MWQTQGWSNQLTSFNIKDPPLSQTFPLALFLIRFGKCSSNYFCTGVTVHNQKFLLELFLNPQTDSESESEIRRRVSFCHDLIFFSFRGPVWTTGTHGVRMENAAAAAVAALPWEPGAASPSGTSYIWSVVLNGTFRVNQATESRHWRRGVSWGERSEVVEEARLHHACSF